MTIKPFEEIINPVPDPVRVFILTIDLFKSLNISGIVGAIILFAGPEIGAGVGIGAVSYTHLTLPTSDLV
mgnify:CR=1 FL=1